MGFTFITEKHGFFAMDDIEDLVKDDGEVLVPRQRYAVMPRVRKRGKNKENENGMVNGFECKTDCESYIPGTGNIWPKTWGCAHNNSDSEYMAGQLAAYGHKIVEKCEDADLWLLNSCTVKNPAEDHFRNEIKAGRDAEKKVVVA